MNSLIIGKNGLIARHLSNYFNQSKNQSDKYYYTSSNTEDKCRKTIFLDLADPSSFDYSIVKTYPNIIMLGAISSPDECEKNPNKSKKINYYGTKIFIEKCLALNAKVLFFSSDLVYGHSNYEMNELTDVNPSCNYSAWKYKIEKTFEKNENFKIFRLSYVLSSEDKFLRYLIDCKNNSRSAEIYDPLVRNVVYIEDVSIAILNIFKNWRDNPSLINVCGDESISRLKIAENFLNKSFIKKINPNDSFWKIRPKNINLKSLYFSDLIKKKPTSFHDAINKLKLVINIS